tara:strand:- start:417 stop:1088 length:672 start_codon:yes stop_codon:yes gene_type:complete
VIAKGPTIPEAIYKLFGVHVAKESPLLKNKANSFIRNGLVAVEREARVQRDSVHLMPGQEVILGNALVLNAIFPSTSNTKKIFENSKYRLECADTVRTLLKDRNSLLGQAFQSRTVEELIDFLCDLRRDLNTEPLPNPFSVLPQVALGKNSDLLQTLLSQATALDPGDSFLLAYIEGDWEQAQNLSSQISCGTPELLALKAEVDRKLAEAHEFDDLLNFFRKK